jgi:GT2 family glycosyltransferase
MNQAANADLPAPGDGAKVPRVVSLILVWNEIEDTSRCIESLLAADYPDQHILLADNGSREGIVAALRDRFPFVEILELGRNLGFSAGNNAGIEHARRSGFDYVFLLNQDTVVAADALRQLVGFAEEHADAGIVGPAVLCYPEDSLLYAAGGSIIWRAGETHNLGMFEPAATSPHLGPPRAVDFVPGCGMLVRARFLDDVGLLDPAYFFNYEEVAWAVRGRRAGFTCWCVPAARMWHKISASLGSSSPANTYYMTRNALRFFWCNSRGASRIEATARILLRTLRTVVAWTVKPTYRSDGYRRRALANLMAIRDFLRGRYGPMGRGVARVCGLAR